MRSARWTPALLALLVWGPNVCPAQQKAAEKPAVKPAETTAPAKPAAPALSGDEQTLKSAHLTLAPTDLLDFFRKRTVTEVEPGRLAALVRQLGAPAEAARAAAFGELVCFGPAAVAAVRQAANDLDDLDAAARARQCLQFLEGDGSANLARTAARLLGRQHPPEAAAVLLAYLPAADDEGVVEEVGAVLATLAVPGGKPAPAVLKSLEDPSPIRRAVAAEVLCRAGGVAQHARVRPLLKDPKPYVRLHAALGLARDYDAEAVPVLIDLLAELAPAERSLAEEYLNGLAGEWAVKVPQGTEDVLRHVRRDAWAAWWKSTTGTNLLAEFRKRTLSLADREKVLGLIRGLGDADLATREKASAALLALGPVAAPLLHQAADTDTPQVRLYAGKCLELIEKDGSTVLPAPAVRLVALRKPAGAAEALLEYLPFAENEALTEELKTALAAVAFPDGKPDPVLVKALDDPLAARRAAAAEVLCRDSRPERTEPARRLLQDADLNVRLRAALALAGAGDRQAVAVLIALLGELPADQSWKAEEYLYRLAGEKAPAFPKESDQAARNRWRDEWAAWWQKNGASVDLVKLDRSGYALGLTLVVESYNPTRRTGRVFELNSAGKTLWQIDGLLYPQDAQYLPGNRVLIAEQNSNRVTERDLKGTIVWQKAVTNPFRCQRLTNGDTFIAGRTQIVEVDRAGKEKALYQAPQGNIAAAGRLGDGQIALVTYQGQYVRLDPRGKEVKSAAISFVANGAHLVDFLPGDHLLVADRTANKVAEYDLGGKVFWEAKVEAPGLLTRLPNGHVLVVSQNSRVVELNRAGREVKEFKGDMTPWRAWRR